MSWPNQGTVPAAGSAWFAPVSCVVLWLGLTSPCEFSQALRGLAGSLTVLVPAHPFEVCRNAPVLERKRAGYFSWTSGLQTQPCSVTPQ